jgi:hypothetical protein
MPISLFARQSILCWCLATLSPALALAQANFGTNGVQYAIAGTLPGDQVHPQAAVSASGGYVVWEDNITDGAGLGISARRLDATLSGSLSTFRVNATGTSDQERPQVSLLNAGGAAFVWQGGKQGFQRIYARFLSAAGTWVSTNDVLVNTFTNNAKVNPAAVTLAGGNVAVVWGSFNQFAANSLQDVYGQLLSPTGAKVGSEFLLNQFASYNQRTPAIAALSGGGFVVVWVSEGERVSDSSGPTSVDIYARFFSATGAAQGNEFLVNSANNICANPSVTAAPNGGFMVAWAEKNLLAGANGWDVYARAFSSAGIGGAATRVNTNTYGDQFAPKISSVGNDFFVVWTSLGQDGSAEGVFGQFLHVDASLAGSELRVNTGVLNSQIHPTVVGDGSQRFLAVWTSYVGLPNSMDLCAQRYATTLEPLAPMDPPFVAILSSNALAVSWPPLAGFSVGSYQVYADGATTPTASVTNTWWTMTNLAPASTHWFQVAYVLTSGRQSPLSGATTNATYGTLTWGGIPYEWMIWYYGSDVFGWPSPNADTDGDGVTTRNEFLAGTDPTDATSVLKVRLLPTPAGLFLNWNTEPGLIYQLQTSTNLGAWSNVGQPRLAAGVLDSVYVGPSKVGYYRIVRMR